MGIAVAAAAVGQSSAPPAETKQLDFWVGNWTCSGETHGPGGKTQPTKGENTISRSFDGFVVQENFRMPGLHGMSVSVYDPNAKLWRQTWVDNSGSYIALTGKKEGDRVILTTLPRPLRPETASRMVFYNITKESFDWDWEGTKDGGKTWSLAWRLHYKRKK